MNEYLNQVRHIRFSPAMVPILWGTGVGMAQNSHFGWAYFFLISSFLWAIPYWLNSDRMVKEEKKSRQLPKARKGITPEQIEVIRLKKKRHFIAMKWGPLAGLAVFIGVCCFINHAWAVEHELDANEGFLIPASDPMPDTTCVRRSKPEDYVVFAGDTTAYFSAFPHMIIEANNSIPVLWLTQDSTGHVGINFDIRSPDMKIVAQLRDNHFVLNSNAMLKKNRPDLSTIEVKDSYGNDSLNIRFMNPHAISISGLLSFPGAKVLVIPPGQLDRESKLCAGYSHTDIEIVPDREVGRP